MRYVLDSSVALKWFLAEAGSPKTCDLVTADAKLVANLGAPFPFIVELASL